MFDSKTYYKNMLLIIPEPLIITQELVFQRVGVTFPRLHSYLNIICVCSEIIMKKFYGLSLVNHFFNKKLLMLFTVKR